MGLARGLVEPGYCRGCDYLLPTGFFCSAVTLFSRISIRFQGDFEFLEHHRLFGIGLGTGACWHLACWRRYWKWGVTSMPSGEILTERPFEFF